MARPRAGWADLNPTTRARYEKAGVSRSEYESGASLAAARRVNPAKEAAQKRAKTAASQQAAIKQARAWSREHGGTKTKFVLPKSLTPAQQVARARDYLAMTKEIEKGWVPASQREPANPKNLQRWFRHTKHKIDTADEFHSISPKRNKRRTR